MLLRNKRTRMHLVASREYRSLENIRCPVALFSLVTCVDELLCVHHRKEAEKEKKGPGAVKTVGKINDDESESDSSETDNNDSDDDSEDKVRCRLWCFPFLLVLIRYVCFYGASV